MSAIYDDLNFVKSRKRTRGRCKKAGRSPCISIDSMAWVFEKLIEDRPIKSIAADLDVSPRTLSLWIGKAERLGFGAWAQYE